MGVKAIATLALCMSAAVAWSDDRKKYFDAAIALGARGKAVGELMSRYKPAVRGQGAEQRQADLALLWSIAETGSICAILGGNIVGAAAQMSRNERSTFESRVVDGSISLCRQFISEKTVFLNAVVKVRRDQDTIKFATELASQLRQLDLELQSAKGL